MIENFSYYIKVIYLININITCLYLYITIWNNKKIFIEIVPFSFKSRDKSFICKIIEFESLRLFKSHECY